MGIRDIHAVSAKRRKGETMDKITVVLPSLNPDEKMTALVDHLVEAGFKDIVIVDDGSDHRHKQPFCLVKRHAACTVLNHQENKGKGRALKTAFAFVLNHRPDSLGVVTVDGDGQHRIEDIRACCLALLAEPDKVVLGCRDFTALDVPRRSRLGNRLTAAVFRLFFSMGISDTQTGLRAIPRQLLQEFCKVEGERFEYETNMLLYIKKAGLRIREVPISTVYLEKNKSSHFRPFADSVKIYGAILRFSLSSLSASLLDVGLFTLLNFFLAPYLERAGRILVSTVLSRVISALFNYTLNHKAVFKSKAPPGQTLFRYSLLCVLQMLTSYGLVLLLSALLKAGPGADSFLKIAVDVLLFFVSFRVQQEWVFADKKNQGPDGGLEI